MSRAVTILGGLTRSVVGAHDNSLEHWRRFGGAPRRNWQNGLTTLRTAYETRAQVVSAFNAQAEGPPTAEPMRLATPVLFDDADVHEKATRPAQHPHRMQ